MGRRVVITGIGALSPNAIGAEAFWEALAAGKSGIKKVTSFAVDSYPTHIAGEIHNFDPTDCMSPRDVRRTSRATQFAVATAKMAVSDAQLRLEEENEVGVIMGVSASPLDIASAQHTLLMERGISRVSPFGATAIIPSSAANNISTSLGCSGMVLTISNSCPAGLDAIGYAFRRILYGSDNVFITGGTDAQINPLVFALLCAARAMSERNDDPEGASRPFDRTRDGGVLSEAAGILIVEEMEHAMSRGAHIYAEILGYASRADGFKPYKLRTSGNFASGIKRAMCLAIQHSDISPLEIDYICAHAPSDDFDRIETMAIKEIFGQYSYRLPVSSIKSMIGNPLSAAGPLQLIASIMVLKRGIIPPTINYENPDPDCDLNYVSGKSRQCGGISNILINSHGFGGVNSSLIIGRPK